MWVLQGHFQSERNFSFDSLNAAHQRLVRYRNFAALRWQGEGDDLGDTQQLILESLNNNLNSAEALAELDQVTANTIPSKKFIQFLDDCFGLQLVDSTPDIPAETKQKIAERDAAKNAKNYTEADRLRGELLDNGIILLDKVNGANWQYKD